MCVRAPHSLQQKAHFYFSRDAELQHSKAVISKKLSQHDVNVYHFVKWKERAVRQGNKDNLPESKCELRAKPGLKYEADMIRSARAAGILSIPKMLLDFALKSMCPSLIRVVLW